MWLAIGNTNFAWDICAVNFCLVHQFDLCEVASTAGYLMMLGKALTSTRVRFKYIMLQNHNDTKVFICSFWKKFKKLKKAAEVEKIQERGGFWFLFSDLGRSLLSYVLPPLKLLD